MSAQSSIRPRYLSRTLFKYAHSIWQVSSLVISGSGRSRSNSRLIGSSWWATIWLGKFSRFDDGAVSRDGRLLDHVLQLTDVPGPVVAQEARKCEPRKRLFGQITLGQLAQKVLDQERDVFQSLAERRHFNREDVEPIKQVFPEPAGRDGFRQVKVGRGDDATVCFDRLGAAHPLKPAVLQHPQQFGLHPQGHFADFVEKKSPSIGELKTPFLLTVGAGERAPLVAKKLALQERLRAAPRS